MPGCCCWSGRPCTAARRRCPAATSTSAAGPRCRRRPATRTRSRRWSKYLTATSKEPEPDKIRAYCEGSVEHFDWLETLGFEFERSYYPEKAVIQPGTQGLMFTGNEKVWPYLDQARPAPRGHKVPVPGDTDGTKLVMDLLRDRVEEAGRRGALRDRREPTSSPRVR